MDHVSYTCISFVADLYDEVMFLRNLFMGRTVPSVAGRKALLDKVSACPSRFLLQKSFRISLDRTIFSLVARERGLQTRAQPIDREVKPLFYSGYGSS
jgi:hypothetical protein